MERRFVRHSAAVAMAATTIIVAFAGGVHGGTLRADGGVDEYHRFPNNRPTAAAAPESLLRRLPHLPRIPSPLRIFRPAPPSPGPVHGQAAVDTPMHVPKPLSADDNKKHQELFKYQQEQQLKQEQQAKQKQHDQLLKQKQQEQLKPKSGTVAVMPKTGTVDVTSTTPDYGVRPTPVRAESTSPKTVKLETTTQDRSIIVAPFKACPEGQRMSADRKCMPVFVDPEGSR